MKKIIVAIDGYSSCGKSTLAKDLARTVGYRYIDSGAMYRAVTLQAIRNGLFMGDSLDLPELKALLPETKIDFRLNPATGHSDTFLNGENVEIEIRSMAVADKVSPIAAVGFVREALVAIQQAFGLEKGIVMDGRDIGTVVFPQAELKVFVTARPGVRALRRQAELAAKGNTVPLEEVLNNLAKRDHIDSTRQDGPLRQAPDAILLDNSDLTIEQQNAWLLERFNEIVKSQP